MKPNDFARFFAYFFVILYLLIPIVFAVTSQNTTMTWFVPSNKNFTLTYGGSCSATAFFFPESIGIDDADADGNVSRVLPSISRNGNDGNCQSSTVAGMTIQNTGNVTYDVNALFTGNIDTNLWLKVWQGNGSGCGTNGMGGWALRCQLTENNVGFDLNEATGGVGCRDFNSSNDLISATLVVSLPVNDTNQLCFSGDLLGSVSGSPANVAQGDHNGTFQAIAEGS